MGRVNESPGQRFAADCAGLCVATTGRPNRVAGINARARHLILTFTSVIVLILVAAVGGPDLRSSGPNTLEYRAGDFLQPHSPPERLSAAEFAGFVRNFSEDGGYFFSDNLTSNETAYLHVVSKLQKFGVSGGAYIGVGPEQNFTYIAKVRPRIAFIVDIRRQAIIQHLMFKAIFHLAPTRAQYLTLLLSKAVKDKQKLPGPNAGVNEILAFIGDLPASDRAYETNLEAIRKTISQDFQLRLSDSDEAGLAYVYRSFWADGLDTAFRMDSGFGGAFPTLKELILQPDQFGRLGNFLSNRQDYDYVRQLHERNLIIPVVGDFAGQKALAAIADYLRKNGLTVSAFYTSNVEQYLFQDGVFNSFVANVRQLPLDERSMFIRAVLNMRFNHPGRIGDHMLTSLLQKMSVFLNDFDAGLYHDYFDMVTSHYIAGETPPR